MKLLIFGASGKTGHELVKQALGNGHIVKAFVRNPAKLNIAHRNLEVIQGNIINYQIVDETIKEQDAVLSALGATNPFKYDQAVVDGVRNIIKAMEANNVTRFIYMSGIVVKESRSNAGLLIRSLAPILMRTETAGHEIREKMISQSRLEWTIVRASRLTNGAPTASYRSGENIRANGITASISRVDVADFMLHQLRETGYLRKAPMIMY